MSFPDTGKATTTTHTTEWIRWEGVPITGEFSRSPMKGFTFRGNVTVTKRGGSEMTVTGRLEAKSADGKDRFSFDVSLKFTKNEWDGKCPGFRQNGSFTLVEGDGNFIVPKPLKFRVESGVYKDPATGGFSLLGFWYFSP
jgi:hypothetical protein